MACRGPLLVLFVTITFLCSSLAATESTRIDVNRDAWISAFPGEQEGNNGGAPRLKLKGIQEFFLIDFDATPHQGKRVRRAELRVKSASEDAARRITVSSVKTQWNEGNGNSYDKETDGCSFLWAVAGKTPWAADGSDLTAVTLGNGGSIWSFGDASPPDRDGWQRIPIAPEIIQTRLDGESFGFLVMDDVGSEYQRTGERFEYRLMPNRFFYSRDQNRASAPYFVVWFEDNIKSGLKSPDLIIDSNETPTNPKTISKTEQEPSQHNPKREAFVKLLNGTKSLPKIIGDEARDIELWDVDAKQKASAKLGIARGETVTKVIDASPDLLQIEAPKGFEIETFALPRIENQLDPAVPLEKWNPKEIGLSTDSSLATGIDIYATKSLAPGDYQIRFKSGDKSTLLSVRVWNFNLPDRLSFIPQMNCYGLPPMAGSYYELCHNHRTTLNSLRYGWTGKVSPDAVPKKKSDGNWDWNDWDRQWGPLLDGSAFANSRRGPIPIEAFYLPINENWPMDHEKHFQGGYWIESAYGKEYWDEFRNIAREFANHIQEKKYHDTLFEFYLNNKVYFKQQRGGRWDGSSAPWVFDEPVNTQDFWALRKFGIEFWRGVENVAGPKFSFRVDISRPQWQRELLDGISNVEVVSGALRQYQSRIIERAQKYNNIVYMYGSANTFDQSNKTNIAWCVETWARGGDGVVPWQTMGTKDSWKKLDPLSVVYPTDFGAVPSLRLKSFRDGQQLVEYLEAFRINADIPRTEMGAVLLENFGLLGKTVKLNEEDAGSVRFGNQDLERLEQLRWTLGEYLDQYSSSEAPLPVIQKARNGLQLDRDREIVKLPD